MQSSREQAKVDAKRMHDTMPGAQCPFVASIRNLSALSRTRSKTFRLFGIGVAISINHEALTWAGGIRFRIAPTSDGYRRTTTA